MYVQHFIFLENKLQEEINNDSSHISLKVLPKLDQIPETKDEAGGLDNQLEALKLLAELSPFYVVHEDTPQHITSIVDCLFVSDFNRV